MKQQKIELFDEEEIKDEIQEFKNFAFKKNMIGLAVAVILGEAFGKLVSSVSSSFLMPIINATLSQAGGGWRDLTITIGDSIILEVGKFCGTFLDFILTALVLYLIAVKFLGHLLGTKTSTDKPKRQDTIIGLPE